MRKYIVTSAVLLAVAVPAIGFAANSTSTGTLGNSVKNFVQKQKQMPEIPQTVKDALTASGITLPTAEQMKAFHDKMQAVHTAVQNLSDADKASLEAIREEAKLKEREFLRSKGVALPTEAEIAEMEKNKQAIHDAMKAAGYKGKEMKMKGKGPK